MTQSDGRWFRVGRRSRHRCDRARRCLTPELGEGLEGRALCTITGLSASASPVILRQINPMNEPHAVQVAIVRPVTLAVYVLEDASFVPSVSFRVVDEYGRDQPSGTLPAQPTKNDLFFYSTRIGLNRTRRPGDRDGRQYTVIFTATDPESTRMMAVAVTTPHALRGHRDRSGSDSVN